MKNKLSYLILLVLLTPAVADGQKRITENWDAILIMKDRSEKKVEIWGSDHKAIYSLPNLKGAIYFALIDTVILINEKKESLRELVWRIPIRFQNNQQFNVRDLFITDLPYTNNGELVFESKVILESSFNIIDRLISRLRSYSKNSVMIDIDKKDNSLKTRIVHEMSPGTRADKYLFYESSSMTTIVSIFLSSDTLLTRIEIIEYSFDKKKDSSGKIIEFEKHYPNDLYRKANYYYGSRPIKFNQVLRNETVGIVESLLKYINEIY